MGFRQLKVLPMAAGGQALSLTSNTRATCGAVETDPAVLALYHEECNATDLEVWTALPLDISRVGLPSRNLIVHGYTVQNTLFHRASSEMPMLGQAMCTVELVHSQEGSVVLRQSGSPCVTACTMAVSLSVYTMCR